MNPLEELNYLPNYQQFLFEGAESISESSHMKRKCLVQTYCASLNLLNADDALQLLKRNLNSYSNANTDLKNNSEPKCAKSEIKEVRSNLNNIDINEFLSPLPCNSAIFCDNSNDINERSLQEFTGIFSKQKRFVPKELDNEQQKVRKIAKRFTPNCLPKENKTFKVSSFVAKATMVIKEEETESEVRPKNVNCFRTANEELQLQNLKKFGARATSQSYLPNQKSKLGGRRNKFVSPMLSNTGSEEFLPKAEEWPPDQIIDERLKNIEPRMVELIRSEIMDSGATVDWDDIAGLEFAKTAIQEAVVWPLLRPDIFTGLRRPPKGILLFGPPGTGKTLIGKCVASQSNSTFFSISASSLTSKWIGDGEKMVRALFAVARCHQPAVIFIDEIDSLLSQRSESEHESSRRIKTEFLVQLDGATTDNDELILVIGATNRPQELDEAARRRFVKRLYIPLPEYQARHQLVKKLLSLERHVLTDLNIQEISQLSDGYSGADMKNLCSEASLGPIRSIDMRMMQSIKSDEVRAISMEDFEKALTRVKSSVSPNDLEQYLKWNGIYGCGI